MVDIPESPQCRMCLENMDIEQGYIHPCQCTSPVHETCLLKWVQSSQKDVCEVCQIGYKIPMVIPPLSKVPDIILRPYPHPPDNTRSKEALRNLGCIILCVMGVALVLLIIHAR